MRANVLLVVRSGSLVDLVRRLEQRVRPLARPSALERLRSTASAAGCARAAPVYDDADAGRRARRGRPAAALADRAAAVEVDGRRSVEVDLHGGDAGARRSRDGARGCPTRQRATDLHALAERRSPSRMSRRPSSGCARGATSQSPEALGVHRRRPRGRATTLGGRRGGRRTSAAARRAATAPRSTGSVHRRRRTAQSRLVAGARRGCGTGRRRAGRAAGRGSLAATGGRRRSPRLGVGPHDDAVGREAAPAAPGLALRIVTRVIVAIAVDLDGGRRRDRRRDDSASAAWRPRGAPTSPASGATSPIWRSRSMSCFTLRTKSPPVSSSSSSTSASVVAGRPRVGQAQNVGSGGRVRSGARPRPRRGSARSRAARCARHRSRTFGGGEPRVRAAASGCGARR